MEFLQKALDDPHAQPCGECANCRTVGRLPTTPNPDMRKKAEAFCRREYVPIEPRERMPFKLQNSAFQFPRATIPEPLRPELGFALALYRFGGWGELAAAQRYAERPHFDHEMVAAMAGMVVRMIGQKVEYVTCVPSLTNPTLVPDFAKRLAERLKLQFYPIVSKVKPTKPQKEMQNGQQQVQNLEGAFQVEMPPNLKDKAVLLVDDICNSGWTFAIIAILLRSAGSGPVYPAAITKT